MTERTMKDSVLKVTSGLLKIWTACNIASRAFPKRLTLLASALPMELSYAASYSLARVLLDFRRLHTMILPVHLQPVKLTPGVLLGPQVILSTLQGRLVGDLPLQSSRVSVKGRHG